MDNPEFQPPQARSMSDAELEVALEQAKAQADGMLGAMMLLEQQSQLRAEDDQAIAAWLAGMKSDPRPEAQAAVVNFERSLAGLPPVELVQQPIAADEVTNVADEVTNKVNAEPEFAQPAPIPEVVEIDLPQVHEESGISVAEPSPIPAPTLEEVAFDELLAMGASEATEGIRVVDNFSLTGVVGQIVDSVEETFVPTPEEAATAVEEQEFDAAPVAAFTNVATAERFDWKSFASNKVISALVIPVVLLIWGASNGVSLSTAILGTSLGSMLAFGIGSVTQRALARSDRSVSIVSRATFGVFGNLLPATVNLFFRLVSLVAALLFLVFAFRNTVVGVDLSGDVAGIPAVSIAVAVLIASALILSLLPNVFRAWAGVTVFAAVFFWMLFTSIYLRPTSWNFGEVSLGQVVFLGIVLLLAHLAIAGIGSEKPNTGTASFGARFSFDVLLPVGVVTMLGSAFLQSAVLTGSIGSNGLTKLVSSSDLWFGTFTNVAAVLVALALASQLLRFAAEALSAFFVPTRLSYALVTIKALAVLATVTWISPVSWALPSLVILLLTGTTTWLGMLLTETILRHQSFHDVSLLRGYGFYKRISIFATLGFVISMVFAAAVTQVPGLPILGSAGPYLDSVLVFGELSAPVIGLLFGVLWSLITAIPKIHRQEADIAAIDERKQQIAGIDLPS